MSFFRIPKGRVSRYSFLVQLLITGVLVILIPTLMLSATNTRNRAEEMKRSHQAQCVQTALTVSDQFEHYCDSLYLLSYRLHEATNQLYLQQQSTVSQELELLQRINRLVSGYTFLEKTGIYFPSIDDSIIYMTTGKYRLSTFANYVVKLDQDVLRERLLSAEPFVIGATQESGLSIYGIPLRFYTNRTPSVALYFFSQTSITDSVKALLPAGCRIYSITTPNGEKLFCNDLLAQSYDPDGKAFDQLTLENNHYFFVSVENESGYGCSLLIPQSHLVSLTDQYAMLSMQYLIVTLALSLLGVVIMCIINYMPLYRLVHSVVNIQHKSFERDEFSILRETYLYREESYNQIQNRLREERIWLIDHIYDCLLRQLPISQNELKILYQYMPHYVVICVQMDQQRIVQCLKDHMNLLQSPVYVFNSDSKPVFICRIETVDENGVQQAMENVRSLVGCAEMAASEVSSNLEELYERYQEASKAIQRLGSTQESILKAEDPSLEDQLEERNENHLKIIYYIEEHFTDPSLSVTSLAEELGTSEYTAGRLIRNIYGPNFRRIINEKRLAYAKALLLTSDYPVSEISKMSGFQSSSYFIKVFKQMEGSTPAQYRDSVKQIESEEEAASAPREP